jgi:hypothetical protein
MTDEILYGVDREFLILFHILYAEVLYMLGDVLMHGRLEGFFDYGHCPLRITPRSPMCQTAKTSILWRSLFPQTSIGNAVHKRSEQCLEGVSRHPALRPKYKRLRSRSKYPFLTLTVGFVLFKTKHTPIYFDFAFLAQINATFTMAITIHDYYRYKPSFDAAIVVAILYTLGFLSTILQFLRYRSWVWTVMVLESGSEYHWRRKSTRSILTNISGGGWVCYKVYISQEH